jgi:hypothetical protein
MVLTFPMTMPTVGAMAQTFEPERVDYVSPEAGGMMGAMTAGFPRWLMKMTLNSMSFADADIWRAWLAVQRGPQRPFFAFDIDRQHPRYHRDGRPYNPSPASWSQTINGDDLAMLGLTGLLPGQTVSMGDYIGLVWGGSKRALVRAVDTGRAGASGLLSVAVEPPLPPIVPANAKVTLRRAGCMMRLVTGETKLGEQGLGYFTSGSTISAAQDLIA